MFQLLKNCVLCLIALLVLSNGRVAELAKVPLLAEHYSEHQSTQNDLSFFEFLAMHYWGDDANEFDNDVDQQLPFNDVGTSLEITMINEALFSVKPIDLGYPQSKQSENHCTNLKSNYCFNYLSCIIQPPEFA